MARDKLTLRLSQELNKSTKEKADYLGISQNNLLVVLIDLGLKCYEASPREMAEKLLR